jgi:phage gpG-like protein
LQKKNKKKHKKTVKCIQKKCIQKGSRTQKWIGVVSHHLLTPFFPSAQSSKEGKNEKMENWRRRKRNHPGTKLMFPARLPTSLSTSSEFHSQVRDGLAWFH